MVDADSAVSSYCDYGPACKERLDLAEWPKKANEMERKRMRTTKWTRVVPAVGTAGGGRKREVWSRDHVTR